MTDFPRRVPELKDLPARERAIIYLVNRLRRAHQAYHSAATQAEAMGALADFERASAQLELIGIRVDDSNG